MFNDDDLSVMTRMWVRSKGRPDGEACLGLHVKSSLVALLASFLSELSELEVQTCLKPV